MHAAGASLNIGQGFQVLFFRDQPDVSDLGQPLNIHQ